MLSGFVALFNWRMWEHVRELLDSVVVRLLGDIHLRPPGGRESFHYYSVQSATSFLATTTDVWRATGGLIEGKSKRN